MKNYNLDKVNNWDMVLGYENFEGNIRMLYIAGSDNAYIYKAEFDEMEHINKSIYLALFYRIIDDISRIAHIKKSILKYLANNVYIMNHYPMKSKELMQLIIDFTVITGEVGKIITE